ncbi:phosphopantetheine-containing protein (plasmid) [Cylindrospermum stagnale PCC 7417]|uniref:Phosphopantetheine-containing protein n=1 Tax=Cylindrospermum stagnale PCC 7417 TaxID=56107 RepID=K9X818_9NOST|nr:acyl carrier protein [Cylindrospermum stagnale]AFZ28254.1 phosphopantetheine-containing protein [Cylindrospermum stagnale PCC 7417]
MKEAKIKIQKFLAQSFGHHEFQEDEDIFSLGFVNSMFAMQLVLFLEKEFQITIENEDLEFENFRSINAMSSFLEKKMHILAQN